MRFLSKIIVACFILFMIGTVILIYVDDKTPRPEPIPIEDREPNYIINGEEVYCFMMSRNAFGTGIELDGCSNGKTYYNAQNVVALP